MLPHRAEASVPTRLVVCVDDGGTKSSAGQTNVQRIFAAVKHGKYCTDRVTGTVFSQVPQYVAGDDTIQGSVLGQSYLRDLEEVYRSCSQLKGEKDEVWLFGFGRGAYIVRAVAGLLHQCGALNTADRSDFAKDFKKVLKEAELRGSRRSSLSLSPVSSIASGSTRPGPRIRFIGAFDTVKAGRGDSIFDISFNGSTQHMRHALALHEDRKTPEGLHPPGLYGTNISEGKRTFIEAWFTGGHADIGGCAKKAGLALYPLQWMLLEARQCGLDVAITSGWPVNPIAAVLPEGGKKSSPPWSCTAANGIDIVMYDFRKLHDNNDYAVKLGARVSSALNVSKPRDVFAASGNLNGYCDFAPQGTIIHPSVYLLLDENVNIALETNELKLQRSLSDWREKMLGSQNGITNTGFWLDEDADDAPDPGAIRVLVCGNTGVGKSTLINKIFGVQVNSDRSRGIHDVREEITFEGRPDLIVHDSGGFEAGADEEYIAIEAFLKEKSAAVDVADRVHVIWFCVDINSPRTLQTATEKLFKAVSDYASDVPILVVATKKDDFLDIEFGAYRKTLKKEGKRFDEEACEQYAEGRLVERIETIKREMETVPGGRLDACVAISQDDDESIAHLSKTTSRCFDTDKVRLLYIRAQVSRIDLKIELALCEVMRRYRRLIRSATGSTFAPFGATITRKVSTTNMIKAIVNCFGLPTVSADAALEALKANVWTTGGSNVVMILAESLQVIGVVGTVFAAGIPAWLVTGAINTSYVVPATCRLFLVMACDLTFVLARSFKEITFRASGQPNEKDVSAAARNYQVRGYSQHVHKDVKALVPRRNMLASFKADAVKEGIDAIFARYKDKLMDNVDLPLRVGRMRIGSNSEADDDSTLGDDNTEADSTLLSDVKEATAALAELDASEPIAELHDGRTVPELPADSKAVELDAVMTTRVELPAEKV